MALAHQFRDLLLRLRRKTLSLGRASPCLGGYFGGVLTTWYNYILGTLKLSHNSKGAGLSWDVTLQLSIPETNETHRVAGILA